MSHHYSGPDFGFPHGDARLDLTDLFAFPKPGSAGKSILIIDVHPSVGLIRQDPPRPSPSHLRQSMNSRLIRTVMRSPISRTAFASRPQRAECRPRRFAALKGWRPPEQATVARLSSTGHRSQWGGTRGLTEAGDYRFFAGWRSDPFFFDTEGALNNLQFTGHDFFADANVCSIALEVPNSALGHGRIGLWIARWMERAGVGFRRTAARCPRNLSFFRARKESLTSPRSRQTMPVSWPSSRTRWSTQAGTRRRKQRESQILCCRTSSTMIPRARRPIRRMVGHSLMTQSIFPPILTNGKVTTETSVGPHSDLLAEFPYLGPPHK